MTGTANQQRAVSTPKPAGTLSEALLSAHQQVSTIDNLVADIVSKIGVSAPDQPSATGSGSQALVLTYDLNSRLASVVNYLSAINGAL